MHLVAYTRVSTAEQGANRNGLEGQAAAIAAWAAANGATLGTVHVEVASGRLGLDARPVLRAAIAEARKARAVLIVSKLDRLSRSVEFVSTLMNSRLRFMTAEDGADCDPFMLHLKASLAEKERAMIGERTRAALAALQARGVALGRARHKDPTASAALAAERSGQASRAAADAFAAGVLPMIRRSVAAGMSYAAIADELNAAGLQTARNGVWVASTVCRVLKRST